MNIEFGLIDRNRLKANEIQHLIFAFDKFRLSTVIRCELITWIEDVLSSSAFRIVSHEAQCWIYASLTFKLIVAAASDICYHHSRTDKTERIKSK